MIVRYWALLVFVFSLFPSTILAQPDLNFKRIDASNFPLIKLFFKVSCDGYYSNIVEKQHLEVFENGLPVGAFEVHCPEEADCCLSIGLVLDRSGSMGEENKIDYLKQGVNTFIDQMNTGGYTCDEAFVVSFREVITLDQTMTRDKVALKAAVNGLVPNGRTAVWDATMVGIDQMSSASNRCKALIVLTDGLDNSSNTSIPYLLQYALDNRVRIFTISYGFETNEAALEVLAASTGGDYYHAPTGDKIIDVFNSIREKIREAYQECYVEYISDCPDGRERVVEMYLNNFCNGNDYGVRTYRAPYHAEEFKDLKLTLQNAQVESLQEVMVPITVDNVVEGIYSESNFSIVSPYMNFVRYEVDGTLLEDIPIRVQGGSGGVTIYTDEKFYLRGPGTLIKLYFEAADVATKLDATLYLANWNIDGYCLIPQMRSGKVTIFPREPELECQLQTPTKLDWDDRKKEFNPDPFTVKVTVPNTGSREATNVYAKIKYDKTKARLVDGFMETQNIRPFTIGVGGFGDATWLMRPVGEDEEGTIDVCVEVYSSNHEMIECCRTIIVNPVQSSQILCDINAPDTIYYHDQYYEPEEFDIELTAINIGTGLALNVDGQLLQDPRFKGLSPPVVRLADEFQPGDTARTSFRVQITSRKTDGYDTVWVQVQGTDGDAAWCYYPIWVQRERHPEFDLTCNAPIDQLAFIEEAQAYVPNPFKVITTATNVGETYAENCRMIFVGPARFTPASSTQRTIDRMNIGDEFIQEWDMIALPRTVAAWDTLEFQIIGWGGYGKKQVSTVCKVPVYVPAMRIPQYEITCNTPDSLQFVDTDYVPNPFEYTVTIKNTGTAAGFGLRPSIGLPSDLSLPAGETASKYIPILDAGAEKTLTWNVIAAKRPVASISSVCVSLLDTAKISGSCCTDIYVPRLEKPTLELTCSSIDSLYLDPSTGEYNGNPFTVTLNIANTGSGDAIDVEAALNFQGTHVVLEDDFIKSVGTIAAGETRTVDWRVRALQRPDDAVIPFTMRVTALEQDEERCNVSVFIPAHKQPFLNAECWSEPEDSLFFDWGIGKFERDVINVFVKVTNNGLLRAENVSAQLLLSSGVVYADMNDQVQKYHPEPYMAPGDSYTFSWKVTPLRDSEGNNAKFEFIVRAANAEDAVCIDPLFIEGSPKRITIELPRDELFSYGQKKMIPITIDRTIGKDLSSYSFELQYDPEVLSILYPTNTAALTEIGWVGSRVTEIEPGHVVISDYTTGTPLHTEDGVLSYLYMEGIFQHEAEISEFGYTELHIVPESVSLNHGEISAAVSDGSAYVTNDCMVPLVASEQYELQQNRPNPFNPSTEIAFYLPIDEHVTLRVFDKMGRDVEVLVDEPLESGAHRVKFTASDLPSGVYFYRIETSSFTAVRKMILAR